MPRFLILEGTHVTSDPADVEKYRKLNRERRSDQQLPTPERRYVSARVKADRELPEYDPSVLVKGPDGKMYPDLSRGDIIELAPDSGELRFLYNNPQKFQCLDGVVGEQANADVAALRAENERLRQQLLAAQGHSVQVGAASLQEGSGVQEVAEEGASGIKEPGTTNLDSMTLDQLKEYAAAEEVDLGTARTKVEILRVLKRGLVATTG